MALENLVQCTFCSDIKQKQGSSVDISEKHQPLPIIIGNEGNVFVHQEPRILLPSRYNPLHRTL